MTEQTAPMGTPDLTAPTETPFTSEDRAALEARVEAAEQRADAAAKAADAATGRKVRYAIWDKTYLRFLPGLHDTRAAAEKAAKADKDLKYRIDEV